MSAITIENDLVHYEVLGRGRPVILLHGWLGSWRYWIPAMQQLSMKYRTYALDFWGFGDSGRDARRYDFASQVLLLDQFMDKLGIAKAALVGHDLGAAVAARYAVQHPDRVPRLMVVSPPLFWMAPKATPLTSNPAPRAIPPVVTPPAAPAAGTPTPAAPATPAAAAPAAPSATPTVPPANAAPSLTLSTPTGVPASAIPEPPPDPVNPDAETVPWRTEEMKARIRAALERRVAAVDVPPARPPEPGPKSPRDAATLPTDQPAKDISTAPVPLPEPLAAVPAMPKLNYVPEPASGQVQNANPLKDFLQTVDRLELLKRHVDPGSDHEKLKSEVEKADTVAVAMSVDSFVDVDTLRDLQALPVPCVTVYGATDTFLPAPDARMISNLVEGRSIFHTISMDGTRHFPMLENIAGFTRLVLDFLEAPDVTKLSIKETWERRVR